MSEFNLSQEALDASNRVLGLLAGASAQSFNQIGYGFDESAAVSGSKPDGDDYNSDLDSASGNGIGTESSESSALNFLSKTSPDSGYGVSLFGQLADSDSSAVLDKAGVLEAGAVQAEMDDHLAWAAAGQTPSSLDTSDSVAGLQTESGALADTSSSFVSDLLSDLLARLSSNDSFEPELDGEKQAAFRDFLDVVGGDLDGSARDFFQSNIQGRIKGVTGEVVDSLGVDALDPVIDPVQDFDYYGTFADLIQDSRDALSLSSIALPQIGPTVAWVRDDLIQRFDA